MKILKRVIRILKNRPEVILRKVVHRLPKVIKGKLLNFPSPSHMQQQVKQIIETYQGDIFVFPLPSCPWGYMFQRPQQIARALAQEGKLVFYLVDTSFPFMPDWKVRGALKVEPNLYLFNDNAGGLELIKACSNRRLMVWQYWPHQRETIANWEKQHNMFKIYDCIDFIETFDQYEQITVDFEKSIIESDCLIATAKSIVKDLQRYEKNAVYIPNAVAIEDFEQYELFDWPLLSKAKKENKTIIGYYGAIADWFDFEVVTYMAKRNPNWMIVLVGEVYPSVETQVQQLISTSNILVLPRVFYSKIPHLLSFFDVAILPFLINQITLNTSPVKVFEYLAGGKCVVSTPLPEVLEIEGVLIGETKQQFELQVKEALNSNNNPNHILKHKEIANQHTWKNRIKQLYEVLERDHEKNFNF